MSAVLKAARAYIDRLGWAVLPCHGKAPAQPEKAGGHGYLSATRDYAEFEHTWRVYAADSVGVACKPNGFFAIDVDPRDGGDETMAKLTAEHGDFPHTVRQISGAGGEHILFRAPESFDPVGSLGDGVQVKWCGYIIAAPSLHEKTRRPYAWSVDHLPSETPIAEPPAWLLERCSKPKINGIKATDWGNVELLRVRVGDRTNTLTRLAGHLFRKRVDPTVAFSLLWTWNSTSCDPPLSLAKFEVTFDGIWQREQRRRAG